jgi:hypothetical protein
MNRPLRNSSVPECDNPCNETTDLPDGTMDILARRLTIITLLLAIFAILLAAAVETDYRRSQQSRTGSLSACVTPALCHTTL